MLGGAAIAALGWCLVSVLQIASAYKAKVLCSGVFVSHRLPADVLRTDLALEHHRWLSGIPVSCDLASGEVRAGWDGLLQAMAVVHPGSGCTLTRPALGVKIRRSREPSSLSRRSSKMPSCMLIPTVLWPRT